jgi:hypothetical protein
MEAIMKQAKILGFSLMVLAILFAGGCANSSVQESDPPNSSEPISPPPTEKVLQSPEASDSVSGEVCVSVDYASDEILDKYDSYDEYVEPEDSSYQVKVIFTTSAPVKDFKFLEGSFVGGEDNNLSFNASNVLYSIDELSPEKPLVIGTVFHGDFPTRGISFVDESNTTRYFTLMMSGKDGSLFLGEF